MGAKYKSGILVGLQMVCIFYLLVKIPFLHCSLWVLPVSFLGVVLGFWAIMTMHSDNFNVVPDVKQNARLVTSGPYKVIRHPMYCSVLLTFSPFVIDQPTLFLVIILIALWIVHLVKLNYEEKLLSEHFKDYKEYSKHTWRLIPFVY